MGLHEPVERGDSMPGKKNTSLLMLTMILVVSVMLQGCGVMSIVGLIVNVLSNTNIMGAVGSALGAAGNIAQNIGATDVGERLGTFGEAVQTIPGAVGDVQQTVQRTQSIFDGQEQITPGTLQDDGTLLDTASMTTGMVSTGLRNARRYTDPYKDSEKFRRIRRYLNRYKELSDKADEKRDKVPEKVGKVKDKLDTMAENAEEVLDKTQKKIDEAEEAADRIAEQVEEKVDSVTEQTEVLREASEELKRGWSTTFKREQKIPTAAQTILENDPNYYDFMLLQNPRDFYGIGNIGDYLPGTMVPDL